MPARATGHRERRRVLSEEFSIVVGLVGGDAVEVAVSGDLDSDSVSRLRAVLNGILRAGHRRLVVDLVRIGAVDGAARETLAKMLKRVRAQGGDMVVRWAAAVSPAP
jgi:anti-anti-sigma factor